MVNSTAVDYGESYSCFALSEVEPTLAPGKQTEAESESDPDTWTVENDGNNVRLNFVLSKKPDE